MCERVGDQSCVRETEVWVWVVGWNGDGRKVGVEQFYGKELRDK